MQALPPALAALGLYPQFIVYKLVPRDGKTAKLPVDHRTGQVMLKDADWQNDPAAWTDADTAISTAARLGPSHGVGFLFRPEDPFFFLDIDNCAEPAGWSWLAHDLCGRLAGAAIEVSQSGKGLHIIGMGTVPPHRCKDKTKLGLELYTEGRFVALTGFNAVGEVATDCTAAIGAIVAQHFQSDAGAVADGKPATWTDRPTAGYTGPANDDELLAKAMRSGDMAGQAFGARATFAALWNADSVVLGRSYPDQYKTPPGPYDASSADMALASHLAFWTGRDCERIDRLMRRSALARPKWDKHTSYMQTTILNAVGGCREVYSISPESVTPPPPESVAPAPVITTPTAPGTDNGPILVDGFQYMAPTQQCDHFAGCVYVQDVHRVFTPRGALLKPDQFRVTYGGYIFVLDAANDKTTKSAWEAFAESQAVRYPIAESQTFRPDLQPGVIVEEEGRTVVNTYTPAIVDRAEGDVTPFLNHLHKMLPDQRDADILLAYMAACVQHIGVKFQWAPLLQGAEGNGKTLFTRCVARAIGMQYTHLPKADEVGNKFNSWMMRKLFIGIEDVYYPADRREIIEALKPLITNDYLPIEFKGVDQINARVCANFMLNTNHKDAIRKTQNDRRFAIFYTAQQSEADIRRDGMAGDYFPDLYDWLKTGGYAKVSHFLATYQIPDELNPATRCHRAPQTSTTAQAIQMSVGGVEQEIMEAIDEGRMGFAGGWVSSLAVDKLLDGMKLSRAIPPNKRREIMQGLGYDWHPALRNGRVNNPTAVDGGGKPKLFIREGHADRAIESPAEAARAYESAQVRGAVSLADLAFGERKA
jgi:hypothetical protein